MLKKSVLLFDTIVHLRAKQIYYRLYYALRKMLRKVFARSSAVSVQTNSRTALKLTDSIALPQSYSKNSFVFLNLPHRFEMAIEWNYSGHGKLWTYNLNYFDFLMQEGLSKEEGMDLIMDFVRDMPRIKEGLMPFPISLRGVNWIKFLSKHEMCDQNINEALREQYALLMENLEYHILGNHLLENAFSLLFGAYYFQEERFYQKAKQLLLEELDEQILPDGAHFELSPMYHQIMLFRVLDGINLLRNNSWKQDELLPFLTQKAEKMLAWLRLMSFSNGDIPLFNDSAKNIAPTTQELHNYALRLDLHEGATSLRECGYRKWTEETYECVVDVGNIGPDYIPGHAHSDTFNFELYIRGKPFIVDTGLSTYETNARRMLERSTSAHNTVEVAGKNQSQVWGGFRVGKRAKIVSLEENKQGVSAVHNGYKDIGVRHRRSFSFAPKSLVIEDLLEGEKSEGRAYLHFSPGIEPAVEGSCIIFESSQISVSSEKITIEEYFYAPEFNTAIAAKVAVINFSQNLHMEIRL
jgi:hypothetical protein